MRVVVALGGNALLRRGEPLTADIQRANVRVAARALAEIAIRHDLIVSHGNGPQVGLLALQGAAYKETAPYPLDLLGAETEGMIGYLIEQELGNLLPPDRHIASLLTQVEVDAADPAFGRPSKPIGPVYTKAEAARVQAQRGWSLAPDGDGYRRVVPSPLPKLIAEIWVIRLLSAQGVVVICAGGGGIPTVRGEDGNLVGVEAVIDKDRASALLAGELQSDALLLLTDVPAVFDQWGTPGARRIRRAPPAVLKAMQFDIGSMGPKVEAACAFAEATGRPAGIGRLEDAVDLLAGRAGTIIDPGARATQWCEAPGG
jgi:carbamate kinase